MKIKSLTLSALCLVTSFSFADSHDDSITELFKTMKMEQQLLEGMNPMNGMMEQMGGQMGMDAAAKQEFADMITQWYVEDVDQAAIIAAMAKVYKEMFTEKDINELNAFYSSSIGQKVLSKNIEISAKMMKVTMEETQKSQHLLMQKIQPFMERQMGVE